MIKVSLEFGAPPNFNSIFCNDHSNPFITNLVILLTTINQTDKRRVSHNLLDLGHNRFST